MHDLNYNKSIKYQGVLDMKFKYVFCLIISVIFFMPFIVNAESKYLYDVLKNEAERGGLAREYTGEHHDSFTEEPSKKIYHWYAANDNEGNQVPEKNNVIFANQCWQMLRTTDTGGVKMIYNGESVNSQCLDSRKKHVGYINIATHNLNNNYWYGTDYEYDATTHKFSVAGTTEQATWNATTWPSLIGKYTCKGTNINSTCDSIYLVDSFSSNSYGYLVEISSSAQFETIGSIGFSKDNNSPAYVGYMHGDIHIPSTVEIGKVSYIDSKHTLPSMTTNTSYWFADSIDIVDNNYVLNNPYQVASSEDFSDLVGKYTFNVNSSTYSGSSVYYIAYVWNSKIYYIELSNGKTLDDYTIEVGDSYTSNGNGTYTINNTNNILLKQFFSNLKSYSNKFICPDYKKTCSSPRKIGENVSNNYYYNYFDVDDQILIAKSHNGLELSDTTTIPKFEKVKYPDYKYTCGNTSNICTETNMTFFTKKDPSDALLIMKNYYFSNDVEWDGTKYTLVNPVDIETASNNEYAGYHYTCPEVGQKTCDNAVYVLYVSRLGYGSTNYRVDNVAKYIKLANGKKIDDILDAMLNKNVEDSLMKKNLEAWYRKYLINYDEAIEDTIYCNKRTIDSSDGWDNNASAYSYMLGYTERNAKSLKCQKVKDQFSINNNKAKLNNKIGLATNAEINILNNKNIVKCKYPYWLLTPYFFYSGAYESGAHNYFVSSSGELPSSYYGAYNKTDLGVRPVISLNSNARVISGSGSKENPYQLSFDPVYSVNVQVVNETSDVDINIEDLTSVEEGEEVKFKITPIYGYELTGIQVIDSDNNEVSYTSTGVQNQYKFTMPASNVTIIPSYKKNRFKVNVTIKNEEEDFNINVEDMTSVLVGEEVVFKTTPVTGYKVSNIQIVDDENNNVNFVSTGNSNEYKFTMPESDVTIIPSYEKVSNSVSVEENEHSLELTVEVNDVSAVVYEDVVVFNVVPEKGYEVDSITITDENNNNIDYEETNNNNEYQFIMPASNVTISPNYKRVSNSVNAENSNHTKEMVIEVNDSKAVVYEDKVVFRVVPEDGYEVDKIEIVDGENNKIPYQRTNNNNEYEFIMPATDVTIRPVYKKIETPKPSIINPKTGSIILLIILGILTCLGIGTYSLKKKRI